MYLIGNYIVLHVMCLIQIHFITFQSYLMISLCQAFETVFEGRNILFFCFSRFHSALE